ncbi:hypothetical protein FSPOR_1932 [Fusarium sporotrichioides]|uniref:Uncharacterized protein n=1 Tax=Fusarium sporotrichioides TaxID=5514 RepID=A0A395SNR6_FUSSP|nr:hypothetical protein FSPOR_1932 [Fusarium sporotrichioides]
MSSKRVENLTSSAAQRVPEDDDYEIIEIIGSDYEDEWDDCEAPLQVKQKASTVTSAISAPKTNKKLTKKETSQEKARKQMAAALKFLEPEIKSKNYPVPLVEYH